MLTKIQTETPFARFENSVLQHRSPQELEGEIHRKLEFTSSRGRPVTRSFYRLRVDSVAKQIGPGGPLPRRDKPKETAAHAS